MLIYCQGGKTMKGDELKELMAKTGKSRQSIYNLAQKLGRKPTVEEINALKAGRPQKYK